MEQRGERGAEGPWGPGAWARVTRSRCCHHHRTRDTVSHTPGTPGTQGTADKDRKCSATGRTEVSEETPAEKRWDRRRRRQLRSNSLDTSPHKGTGEWSFHPPVKEEAELPSMPPADLGGAWTSSGIRVKRAKATQRGLRPQDRLKWTGLQRRLRDRGGGAGRRPGRGRPRLKTSCPAVLWQTEREGSGSRAGLESGRSGRTDGRTAGACGRHRPATRGRKLRPPVLSALITMSTSQRTFPWTWERGFGGRVWGDVVTETSLHPPSPPAPRAYGYPPSRAGSWPRWRSPRSA